MKDNWANGTPCEAHEEVFCPRCTWLFWDDLRAKAALAWKARCSRSRFCEKNQDDPFVTALNTMLAGEDPGDSAIARLARTLVKMAGSDAIPVQAPLHRGSDGTEFFEGQLVEMLGKLNSGESVSVAQPLVSWTDLPGEWDGWSYRWVLGAESDQDSLLPSIGCIALPLGPFGDRSHATEFVTGGLLNVTRIEAAQKKIQPTVIWIEQTTHYVQ